MRPWTKLRAIRQAIIRACTQLFANYEPCVYHSRFTVMRDLSSAALINICLSFTCFPTFYTLRSCKNVNPDNEFTMLSLRRSSTMGCIYGRDKIRNVEESTDAKKNIQGGRAFVGLICS